MATHYNITLQIGARPGGPYLEELHDAIGEVLKLVFSGKETELNEKETYAVHMLIDLQTLCLDGWDIEFEV